jgi:hypothetical protein
VYQRQRYFFGQSLFWLGPYWKKYFLRSYLYILWWSPFIHPPGHGLYIPWLRFNHPLGHGSYTPGVGGGRLLITPFVDVIGKKTISKEPR